MEKYDIILGVGNDCKTAGQLEVNRLRLFAFPLDWMWNYDLNVVIQLFESRFRHFFEHWKSTEEASNKTHLTIQDTTNGMYSIHHFPCGCDVQNFYNKKFYPLMMKRFDFVDKLLSEASSILLVSNHVAEINEFESFLNKFETMYAGNITMHAIRHVADYPSHKVSEYFFGERSRLIVHDFDDRPPGKDSSDPEFWAGNHGEWAKALENVSYADTFLPRIKSRQRVSALRRLPGRIYRKGKRMLRHCFCHRP